MMRSAVRVGPRALATVLAGVAACQTPPTEPGEVPPADPRPAAAVAPFPIPPHRIAFEKSAGIYKIWDNGAGLTKLSTFPPEALRPVWSPAGPQRVAFVMQWDYSDSVVTHLGVMAADGSGVQDLTPTGSHKVSTPVWSPDGTRLAFWDGRASTAGGISVVNADGTGLTTIASEAWATTPAWSPDGQRIVYFRSTDSPRTILNERGIWSVKPDGTGSIRLRGVSADVGKYDGFQFSPDGTRLVMCRTGQSANTLEVMNADGTALVNLLLGCSPVFGSDSPEWSPDGTRILTTHAHNVWTIAPDGSQATQLTSSGTKDRPNQDGHWSRQGNQIAYSHGNESACDGSYDTELWVMSANGSSKDRVTPCGVDVEWISWGP